MSSREGTKLHELKAAIIRKGKVQILFLDGLQRYLCCVRCLLHKNPKAPSQSQWLMSINQDIRGTEPPTHHCLLHKQTEPASLCISPVWVCYLTRETTAHGHMNPLAWCWIFCCKLQGRKLVSIQQLWNFLSLCSCGASFLSCLPLLRKQDNKPTQSDQLQLQTQGAADHSLYKPCRYHTASWSNALLYLVTNRALILHLWWRNLSDYKPL